MCIRDRAIYHFGFDLRCARNRHAFFAVHSGLLARRSAKNVVVVELKTRDRLAFVVYHADQLEMCIRDRCSTGA